MSASILQRMAQAGWQFPEALWAGLTDYERSFVAGEFTGLRTQDYYRARVRCLGLSGNVLDAACGMGQWAVALAAEGCRVCGVDLDSRRLELASALTEAHGADCRFARARMEKLPFAAGHFDAVFCYGALMFAPVEAALAEFARVLRPGGQLYVNANDWGWTLHLALDRGLFAGNLRVLRMALRAAGRTLLRRPDNVVLGTARLSRLLRKHGFEVVATGVEGGICLVRGQALPAAAYPPSHWGLPGVIEAVARRVGG